MTTPTPIEPDEVWDGLFHGCAWAAFAEIAAATGRPPAAEPTRRLAYRLYEEELARRNAGRDNGTPGVLSSGPRPNRTEAP